MTTFHRISSRLAITFCVVTLFLASRLETYACTCMGQPSMKEAVRTADILVSGKIIARQDYQELVCYTVIVSRDFKHTALADTIYIYSGQGGGDCGVTFLPEREYLIYASVSQYLEKHWADERAGRAGREYITSICTRTREKNDEEIANIEKEL